MATKKQKKPEPSAKENRMATAFLKRKPKSLGEFLEDEQDETQNPAPQNKTPEPVVKKTKVLTKDTKRNQGFLLTKELLYGLEDLWFKLRREDVSCSKSQVVDAMIQFGLDNEDELKETLVKMIQGEE